MQHIQENVVPGLQAQLQEHVVNLQAVIDSIQNHAGNAWEQLQFALSALGFNQGNKAVNLPLIIAQLHELAAAAQFQITHVQSQLATILTPEKIRQMLMNAINQIVPESMKPAVLEAFGMNVNNKGWLTDMIGNLFGGMWGGITDVISQNFNTLMTQLGDLVQQAVNEAGQALAKLKEVVETISKMIKEGKIKITATMAAAMQHIISPAMGQLGDAGQTLWNELTNIINGGKP